jgi:hypothetical protein
VRRLALAAAAALLAGCAAPTLPPPIERGAPIDAPRPEFPAQVRLERPGMTCRAATKATRAALKRMGYSVESVTTPSPGVLGEIRALRHGGWSTGEPGDAYQVAARLICDDRGSIIEAATEEGFAARRALERDLPLAVDAATTARTNRPAPTARRAAKLRLAVEPLRGAAAAQVVGGAPEIVGVTPVRIRVDNQTETLYRLQARRVKLVTQEGRSNEPLDIDEVAAALAPEWQAVARERQLGDVDVAPGTAVSGYVFVPAAAYRRAKVVLIEAESEEAEGFSVEF